MQLLPKVLQFWHGVVHVLHVLLEASGYVPAGQLEPITQLVPVRYPVKQVKQAVPLVQVLQGDVHVIHSPEL